jgi:N-acetylneuraminate synthase
MEFTPEQWSGLASHARERELVFLSSPFSPEAVELLERLEVPAWKVASGEISNLPLIERLARTGKPLILSSGMSTWRELDGAVHHAREHGADVAVMQCTTAYPTPPEQLGLNVLPQMAERYGCPVGLSDHSAKPYAGHAAVALGANLIEAHIVFSRECFGPDTSSSLTPSEFMTLVDGVRFIERALSRPVDKDAAASRLEGLRRTFGKVVVAARDLAAGAPIEPNDLALKKAGGGAFGPEKLSLVVGRKLRSPIKDDAPIAEDDLE